MSESNLHQIGPSFHLLVYNRGSNIKTNLATCLEIVLGAMNPLGKLHVSCIVTVNIFINITIVISTKFHCYCLIYTKEITRIHTISCELIKMVYKCGSWTTKMVLRPLYLWQPFNIMKFGIHMILYEFPSRGNKIFSSYNKKLSSMCCITSAPSELMNGVLTCT